MKCIFLMWQWSRWWCIWSGWLGWCNTSISTRISTSTSRHSKSTSSRWIMDFIFEICFLNQYLMFRCLWSIPQTDARWVSTLEGIRTWLHLRSRKHLANLQLMFVLLDDALLLGIFKCFYNIVCIDIDFFMILAAVVVWNVAKSMWENANATFF